MLKYIFTKYLHVHPNTTYFIITCMEREVNLFSRLYVCQLSLKHLFRKKTSFEQMHPPQIQKVKQVVQIKQKESKFVCKIFIGLFPNVDEDFFNYQQVI